MKTTFTKITATSIAVLTAISTLCFSAFASEKMEDKAPGEGAPEKYYSDFMDDYGNKTKDYDYEPQDYEEADDGYDDWETDGGCIYIAGDLDFLA